MVLRRVEHLEQGRARVAAPIGADLVDLVEHDHRVHRVRVPERPDQPAGERPDVRAPVAADLGLVADAAERHPDELASGRPCDRLADRGLAGAGRPDQGQDRAGLLVLVDPALDAQLLDGDVLDDPVLDVLEAGVVRVEDLARVLRIESLLRALAPRHADQPVQVRADHAGLARLLADALEPTELLLGLLADGIGHPGLLDLRAVLLDDRGVVLAELLADRLHLLAQEVLALLLLGTGLDVLADALADLQLGEPLALELQRQLEPLGDVERLQQLDLLLVGEVRAVAAGVGEGARLGDAADECRDTAVVAAQLEDLLDHRAVLALEVAGATVDRGLVRSLLDLDIEAAVGHRVSRAGDPAVKSLKRDGVGAAGQPNAIGDLGNGAGVGKVRLVVGDKEDALLLADVNGERERHPREDDDVVEGD